MTARIERAISPAWLLVGERILQTDRAAVADEGRRALARDEQERAAVVRVAHRRDEALDHLLRDLPRHVRVERGARLAEHGLRVLGGELGAKAHEARREPPRLEHVHRRALELASAQLGEDHLAERDGEASRADGPNDDRVARHGRRQGSASARALQPARSRLQHPPDLEVPLHDAHADERPRELRRGGEAADSRARRTGVAA